MAITQLTPIDVVVCVAGNNELLDAVVPMFLSSLRSKCNLENVRLFAVFRKQLPVSDVVRRLLEFDFNIVEIDIPVRSHCREDASIVCNWMVDNLGSSPLVSVSHFDIVFHQDFFRWARSWMTGERNEGARMVGRHRDGIMLIDRDAYRKCGVGFIGIDNMRAVRDSCGQLRVVGMYEPVDERYRQPGRENGEKLLSLDVGQLLELRMSTLYQHCMFTSGGIFTHIGNGSGHSMDKEQVGQLLRRVRNYQ